MCAARRGSQYEFREESDQESGGVGEPHWLMPNTPGGLSLFLEHRSETQWLREE